MPEPGAPIEAVVWIEHHGEGLTPNADAIRALAGVLGLTILPQPLTSATGTLEVAGGADGVRRFLAGLSLRGAAIVRSQKAARSGLDAKRVLIHIGSAPEPPFEEF
jgi:hypothetical protein